MKLQEHEADIQFNQPWWWSTNIFVHRNQTTCNTILNELSLYCIWKTSEDKHKQPAIFHYIRNELQITKCNNCHAHNLTHIHIHNKIILQH
jgi:hypothetical protein